VELPLGTLSKAPHRFANKIVIRVPGRLKVKTIMGREKTLITKETVRRGLNQRRSWKVHVKFKPKKGVLE
jgi:hypothetical protein